MKHILVKSGRQVLTLLISLTLIISSPGGIVLCIGAEGHAQLKLAYHEKNHHQTRDSCCLCCRSHQHREHESSTDHQSNPSGDKLQTGHEHIQGCIDLVVFEGYAYMGSGNYQSKPIAVGIMGDFAAIFFSFEITQDVFPSHPPDKKNPSLASLQTVILLT